MRRRSQVKADPPPARRIEVRRLGIDVDREEYLPEPAPERYRLEIEPQNDSYSEPWFTNGCRALDLAAIAQLHVGQALPYNTVEKMLKKLSRDLQVVNPDTARTGKEEHVIINATFDLLDAKDMRGRQVKVVGPDKEGWNSDKDFDYALLEFPTNGSVGTHYVVCDKELRLLYDSWKGNDLIVGPWRKLLGYRVWEV